jgi:hypothetical protein
MSQLQRSELTLGVTTYSSSVQRFQDKKTGGLGFHESRSNTTKERTPMTIISRKASLLATLLSLAMIVGTPAKTAAGQSASTQDKVQGCNSMADKKNLKGDDRKSFMQNCVSKAADVQKPSDMSEKDKMNVCKNLADKKSLSGEDRRSFIKDCMKKANPK